IAIVRSKVALRKGKPLNGLTSTGRPAAAFETPVGREAPGEPGPGHVRPARPLARAHADPAEESVGDAFVLVEAGEQRRRAAPDLAFDPPRARQDERGILAVDVEEGAADRGGGDEFAPLEQIRRGAAAPQGAVREEMKGRGALAGRVTLVHVGPPTGRLRNGAGRVHCRTSPGCRARARAALSVIILPAARVRPTGSRPAEFGGKSPAAPAHPGPA